VRARLADLERALAERPADDWAGRVALAEPVLRELGSAPEAGALAERVRRWRAMRDEEAGRTADGIQSKGGGAPPEAAVVTPGPETANERRAVPSPAPDHAKTESSAPEPAKAASPTAGKPAQSPSSAQFAERLRTWLGALKANDPETWKAEAGGMAGDPLFKEKGEAAKALDAAAGVLALGEAIRGHSPRRPPRRPSTPLGDTPLDAHRRSPPLDALPSTPLDALPSTAPSTSIHLSHELGACHLVFHFRVMVCVIEWQ
jgi:hypothetical protein